MKKLLLLASALTLLFSAIPVQAQETTTIQIGGSDFSKLGTPGIPRYQNFFFESLYTTGVLESNGLTTGCIIQKIKFPYIIPVDEKFKNYDIDLWFGSTTRTDIPSGRAGYSADDVAELEHFVVSGAFEIGGTTDAPSYFEYTFNPPIIYDGGNLRLVLTGNCEDGSLVPSYSTNVARLFSTPTDDYRTSTYSLNYSYPSYLDVWENANPNFSKYNKYVLSIVLELADPASVEAATAQEAKIYAADGQLHVEGSSAIQSVKVYDANGALCLSAAPAGEKATLDVDNLNGIYVVEVQTADAVKRAKVQL